MKPHWHIPMDFIAKPLVEITDSCVIKMIVMVMADTNCINVWKLINSARERTIPFYPNHTGHSTVAVKDWVCENIEAIHLYQDSGMTNPGDLHIIGWRRI